MSRRGKLTSLLTEQKPDTKKITEYGLSRKLDVDQLFTLAMEYSCNVGTLGFDINPLHAACMQSNPDIVSALIKEGYNVNIQFGKVESYLRVSLLYGNIPVAKLLLKEGADAQSRNFEGKTPMEAALVKIYKPEKVCVSAVKLLLEAGVSVNAVVQYDTKEKALHIAVLNNLPSVVNLLLKKGADVNLTQKDKSTPLHYACYRNSVEIIKLLTQHKVEFYKQNALQDTPLSIVVKGFFKKALKTLIQGGCDINQLMVGGTLCAIHQAADECHLEKVKYLVSLGADPNRRLVNGMTPLHIIAVRVRCLNVSGESSKVQSTVDILEFLAEKGANVNASDDERRTPLLLAVLNRYLKLAKQLIKLGASPNINISLGKILFHMISSLNNDIITLSLEYGANFNKRNGSGLTPYHTAITCNVDVKLIKSFVQFSCPYNQDVPVWSKSKVHGSGDIQKFFAAEEQFFKGVRENNLKLIQKAVKAGAVPTGCSEECRYPLHFVAINNYKVILKYLLQNAFPVNSLNNKGETALNVAAQKGHFDVCSLLLQFGACYNYHSKKCPKTPEMIANELGHESIVKLIKKVHIKFWLARNGHACIVNILKLIRRQNNDLYLMYVNSINIHSDTVLSTALRHNHSEIASNLIYLRSNVINRHK